MKKTVIIIGLGVAALVDRAYSQETLQSVTSRGSITTTGAFFGGNVGIGGTNQFNRLNLGSGDGDNLPSTMMQRIQIFMDLE